MTPLDITKDTFQAEVLDNAQPVLVDFWATWCGPCKMQSPIVDQLCQERDDVKICKVNVDEEFELAVRYQVSSIPTLMLFQAGQVARKAIGLRSREEIIQLLEEAKQ